MIDMISVISSQFVFTVPAGGGITAVLQVFRNPLTYYNQYSVKYYSNFIFMVFVPQCI